jgi:class 3 adenylate cyclase
MQKTSCAIMFADISGSTRLYEQMGDDVAKKLIDRCLGHLQVVTEAHNGTVIKKIGDELMCRFESAESAVASARVSQFEIKSLQALEKTPLSIRAGVHYGEVIEDEDDIFGDAVNIAARMAGIAKGGQIITTADTVDALSAGLASEVRQVDITRVKGKQEKLAVYEVLWEKSSEVTRVATELLSRSVEKPVKLRLSSGDRVCELGSEIESISIGRDDACDLVVNTALASRRHAICELRRGKFVIVDQGTNGTYVSMAGGGEVYLRREELVLRGKGAISLGKPVAEADPAELIEFEC